jgi:hypothetical protein
VLTTKDGAAVHTAATAKAPAPAVKHVEAKPKKKHRAKKAAAKKPAAAPKASAPEAAAPATAQ